MKITFAEQQIAFRETHLERDAALYASGKFGSFTKIKDWDEKGPTVIWEGVLSNSDLTSYYNIQIHYGKAYPYRRPNVYPIDPRIQDQRHQWPTGSKSILPGSLCLWPHNPDRWIVGMTCENLLDRVILWLKAYETGTLDDEFAPPEIERFFPEANQVSSPEIILGEGLLQTGVAERGGDCLLLPTRSGKFAFLDLLGNADSEAVIAELSRLSRLILPSEVLVKDGWRLGKWFALDKEPSVPVPLNSTNLMNLVANNGRDKNDVHSLVRRNPEVVALRYPTSAGTHWLVLQTKFTFPSRAGFRKQTFDLKVKEVNRINPLKIHKTYHIDRETIFRRVSGYRVEELHQRHCVLLGCGSIGSRVADLLIKSGIGTLTLVDSDRLRAGNVSRHVLRLDSIGQNKADALKAILLKTNPYARIETFGADIVWAPEQMTRLVETGDVIISCMGNDASELFVSSASHGIKPVVFCRSYLQARLGEILLSNTESDCVCFNCAAVYLSRESCPIPRPPELPYDQLVGFDGDCGSAFLPASAVDLDLVSSHCTRLVLSLALGEDSDHNYFLVRGRGFG